jgi:hypothetical protein
MVEQPDRIEALFVGKSRLVEDRICTALLVQEEAEFHVAKLPSRRPRSTLHGRRADARACVQAEFS